MDTQATKARLMARRANYSKRSTFAYPPTLVGARMADGMQWVEDGAIRERHRAWADDVAKAAGHYRAIAHQGWYLDQYDPFPGDSGVARGCVIMLSHGRFIAGYRHTHFPWMRGKDDSTGTCVDVSKLFTCEYEAAQYADECARIAAERESEYQQEERERMEREEREEALDLAHAESDFGD